jgi:hypothetical protein
MPFPCSLKRGYQFRQDLYKHTTSKTLWSEEGKATCMSTSKHELGLRSTAKVSLREVAKLGQPYSTPVWRNDVLMSACLVPPPVRLLYTFDRLAGNLNIGEGTPVDKCIQLLRVT